MTKPTAEDRLGDDVARLVATLRRTMRRAARRSDPALSLSVAQLEFLTVVMENPGIRSSDVAAELHLARNSISTLAGALAELGLLVRHVDPSDGRAVKLKLTSNGTRQVERWLATNATLLRRGVTLLAPGERARLAAALPALRHLIDEVDHMADPA